MFYIHFKVYRQRYSLSYIEIYKVKTDVMNIISLKDQDIIKDLDKVFNPNNLWIDRNNGSFNTKMCLIKDQAAGLYSFANS